MSAGLAALRLSQHQHGELERNGALCSAPTLPALRRYTGVLYTALDANSLRPAQCARLAVASALFGLLRADDRIPAYRLSAASALPGLGSVRSVWRPVLGALLSQIPGLVVDLRSTGYHALGPLPGAVTVQVVSDGGRAVSHHNKAHKAGWLGYSPPRHARYPTPTVSPGSPARPACKCCKPANTHFAFNRLSAVNQRVLPR